MTGKRAKKGCLGAVKGIKQASNRYLIARRRHNDYAVKALLLCRSGKKRWKTAFPASADSLKRHLDMGVFENQLVTGMEVFVTKRKTPRELYGGLRMQDLRCAALPSPA